MELKITTDHRKAAERRYVPLPAGNGSLSLLIDYCGEQNQKTYCNMTPNIRRSGFRHDTRLGELVDFGHFLCRPDGLPEEVEAWTQTLDIGNGRISSVCQYPGNVTVTSECVCHLEHDLLFIRKHVEGLPDPVIRFRYFFSDKRTQVLSDDRGLLLFNVDGGRYKGTISLSSDRDGTFSASGSCYEKTVSEADVTFCLAFGDTERELLRTHSFAELIASHEAAWQAYWKESFLDLPGDRQLLQTYYTAQYHLRISSTKWSIPVGLYDSHWRGLFFGFDEYYAFSGLLNSGHLDRARHVPEFRRSILDKAQNRTSRYFGKIDGSARYPWETTEDGEECTIPGLWMEHIFHMAAITRSAWEFYEHSRDMEYLKETAYPVIRACAEFYRIQSVYESESGRIFIGKCTDLERLGPGRENAFMTTCGVISTFRAAAESASLLGEDEGLRKEWLRLAEGLVKTLPSDGKKYVPYPDCRESSIAILSAVYPFPVLPKEDVLLQNGVQDFIDHQSSCGNMYPLGKSVCAWYAGMKSLLLTRWGRTLDAAQAVREISNETGCFSEIFEIYEAGAHPWFTTAEGTFLCAVNEILLAAAEQDLPLPEEWKNVSFRLSSRTGKMLECSFRNGRKI